MACLRVQASEKIKKERESLYVLLRVREKQKGRVKCVENKWRNDTLHYVPCCNCRDSVAGLTEDSALLFLIKTSV